MLSLHHSQDSGSIALDRTPSAGMWKELVVVAHVAPVHHPRRTKEHQSQVNRAAVNPLIDPLLQDVNLLPSLERIVMMDGVKKSKTL